MPEPYQNLKLGVWRCQMEYLKIRSEGAPEEILESLRQWITQAAFILSGAQAPDPSASLPSGELPPDPMAQQPGDVSVGMPSGPAPQAALAPEAMQLVAH